MKPTLKKGIALLLCVMMCALAACTTSPSSTSTTAPASETTAPAATATPAPTIATSGVTDVDEPTTELDESAGMFPLEEQMQVTVWRPMKPNVALSASNYGELPLYQYLEEYTNIDLEFIHPTMGDEQTAFNLLVASRELPDVIWYSYEGYTGGVRQAMMDGIIIDLMEYIPEYAPDFYAYYEMLPTIRQKWATEDGEFGYFPFLRDPNSGLSNAGLIIRTDLLEKTGLESPTTVEELHQVLLSMRQNTDVKWPMLISNVSNTRSITSDNGVVLSGPWDIVLNFYNDNGTVKYGYYEEAYKDMMKTYSTWYAEGLLDDEFETYTANNLVESAIFGGDWGVFTYNIGPMEKMVAEGQKINPDYMVGGVVPLTLEEGGTNRMLTIMETVAGNDGITITSMCDEEKIPAIVAFANIGYTPEGSQLYSIGIEGETFEYVDGNYVFTDKVLNNDLDITATSYWYRYCHGNDGGSFMLQSNAFANLYWSQPQQVDATNKWTIYAQEAAANPWKLGGTLTAEETSDTATAITDIGTYVNEMFVKFLTGKEDIDASWDSYIAQLDKLGIQDVLAVYQTAEDRYNNN